MKLTKEKEKAVCLSCAECCKRYWITILPEEAKTISMKLKISKKDFLEENCALLIKLFPKSIPGMLTYPTAFFPERIYARLEKEFSPVPQSFFVLPQVALERKRKKCSFLLKDNSCRIYSGRPTVCALFPFIAVSGYRENYPFCGLYKKKKVSDSDRKKSSKHFKKIKKYFKAVDKKGFQGVWKTPPKEGVLFLSEKKIGGISLNELRIIQVQ